MANFTLKVETAASKAKANPPKKDPLFYILPPLIVAAVFLIVYGVQPPAPTKAEPPTAKVSATADESADAEESAATEEPVDTEESAATEEPVDTEESSDENADAETSPAPEDTEDSAE